MSELLCEIIVDLLEVCRKNSDGFREELEIMENLNKTSMQILKEETELMKATEIAKNLLDVLDNTVIAVKTGLSITQVE